ncbi:MAG: divalent-cation tolerance protein CutA [Thiohalocapsa sp.]
MSDIVYLALCTCPDQASAEALADAVVNQGLAACVNILPGVVSVYRWEGKIAKDKEVLLLMKTTQPRFAQLAAEIEKQHPYDVPEVIAHPIVAGLDNYLEWVRTCTRMQD